MHTFPCCSATSGWRVRTAITEMAESPLHMRRNLAYSRLAGAGAGKPVEERGQRQQVPHPEGASPGGQGHEPIEVAGVGPRPENVNLIWPHCACLIWPHLGRVGRAPGH